MNSISVKQTKNAKICNNQPNLDLENVLTNKLQISSIPELEFDISNLTNWSKINRIFENKCNKTSQLPNLSVLCSHVLNGLDENEKIKDY